MQRLLLSLLLFLCSLGVWAQQIVIQDFRLDEKDLTANTKGTTVLDQNGQKCALLKIETTQTGFSFDTGMLGVVKTEQHPGEVWVYVPEGVKRLSITHPQLGILRDHDLGLTLKRAQTYVMRLVTGEVTTSVRQARTSQFVVFQLEPRNAVVRLDGNMLTTSDGTATKYLPFGTYDYTVEAPDYKQEVGKVTVNDPRNKHVVSVRLKPNFSVVTLSVDKQAEIWVNGERRGQGTWTGNMGAGVYMLEARLPNHRPTQREVTIEVTAAPQTIRMDAPTPILGEASITSTPALADVAIDGKPMGQTPLVLSDLLIGQHTLKITKKGYAAYKAQLTITEGQTADLSATLRKQEATSASSSSSSANGHEYVDLGLPSGTLWATCNVGASKPEEYGDYFAWGETTGYNDGKTEFSWSTYKWCNGTENTMTKYCNDSNYGNNGYTDTWTELEPEDDAAYVNWGSEWRMPSLDQMNELINSSYTTTIWTSRNGVWGRLITSKKNRNSIFLPAAGYRDATSLYYAGSYGGCWSRTLYTSAYCACSLDFNSGNVNWYGSDRYYGRSVRPVRTSQN